MTNEAVSSDREIWPNSPSVADEFRVIALMLDAATKAGLLTEVVWSFGNFVSGCVSVKEACAEALQEWDI